MKRGAKVVLIESEALLEGKHCLLEFLNAFLAAPEIVESVGFERNAFVLGLERDCLVEERDSLGILFLLVKQLTLQEKSL